MERNVKSSIEESSESTAELHNLTAGVQGPKLLSAQCRFELPDVGVVFHFVSANAGNK
jgi:hypothetical protein